MLAMWACLFFYVLLGWGCTAYPWGRKEQQAGTPLSDQEYHQFFMFLQVARRAKTACLLRMLYGCQNPLVQRLDKYENHGVIPKGPVCSELPGNPFFPDFCTFSLHRCSSKRYFIKRTACPGETKAAPGNPRLFNDMTTSSDAMLSGIFRPQLGFPVPPSTAHSIPDMDVAVFPTSLRKGVPWPQKMQPHPPHPHATTVKASGQQQKPLPLSDIQDLILRLQNTHVQSSLQRLQQLLAMDKTVGEEELQSAAQKLLVDMNNAGLSQWATSMDTGHRRKK